jgi:MazG family protein
MQVALHTQIASEEGAFRFSDVIGQIDAKLKRRHPHVFGDVHVHDTAEVLRNWEAIKEKERAEGVGGSQLATHSTAHNSRLAGVPVNLPALARAQALGERAARDGFDWPDLAGVLAKVMEEVEELASSHDMQERTQETGDLLFTLVNVARWTGVDAESALRVCCDRFARRYAEMERLAHAQGARLAELSPADKEALWTRAKALVRIPGLQRSGEGSE